MNSNMELAMKVITTGEAAKWCGVSFRTVLRWIERGELEAYKLPGIRGDHRIKLSVFIAFLKKNNMPVPQEFQKLLPRILIIDDDEIEADMIADSLKGHSYEISIAYEGFSAGVMLASFVPDLVTMDLKMPGLSGFDVIEHIKSVNELKNTKILVISGLSQSDMDKARDLGADDVMEKPIDFKLLHAKINSLIHKVSNVA